MNGKVAVTGGLVVLAGVTYMLTAFLAGFAVGLVGATTIAVSLKIR